MAEHEAVSAIYENGVLKLQRPLALREHQAVTIYVLADEVASGPDAERVRWMHRQADGWLAAQPPCAAREPKPIGAKEKARLDTEFEQLLAELQQQSEFDDEETIAALVDEALIATRRGNR